MKLVGSFVINAPQPDVWSKIRDPGVMAGCIPGCEAITQLSEQSFRAVVAVKVGPISARFNLVVEIVAEDPPSIVRSRTRGEEGTRASMVTSENMLVLSSLGPEITKVDYSADVNMTGRLGKYGLGIMMKKAEQLSGVFVETFRGKVEGRTMVS
jgi:hypothetical protein